MHYGRDWFIETLPEVIQLVAQGKNEAGLQTARKIALNAVQAKYPDLKELAQEYVSAECDADKLDQLVSAICLATNEKAVHQLLQGKIS